jgi:hypothetical protein
MAGHMVNFTFTFTFACNSLTMVVSHQNMQEWFDNIHMYLFLQVVGL